MRFPTSVEWLKLVEEFRAGDLSLKEFVTKHDVSFHTCQYWIYRKSKKLLAESKPETKFLPVTVVDSVAPKARQRPPTELIVELPSGAALRVVVGTDADYVAKLVAAIG
jgi:hypothetical protein